MSAEWTFMVYMAGNNSLSDAASDDLAEMRRVGSTEDVSVPIFVKQEDRNAHRILVGKDGRGEIHEDLGDVDSGDPQTVVDFVRWAVETAPAKRYALVLWNHGGGWSPLDMDELYADVRGASGRRSGRDLAFREMTGLAVKRLSRSVFTSTIKEVLSRPTATTRAILTDDGTGHSLDTIELGKTLKAAKRAVGAPLDLLGMDACLMSELEVAFQSRLDVRAIVGSEATEPGPGWPYQQVLEALNADPGTDGAGLAGAIVDAYIASYKRAKSQWPVTQSAVATGKTTTFSRTMEGLTKALRKELPRNWGAIYSAQTQSVEFDGLRLFDLKSVCRNLREADVSAATKRAAQAVEDALEPGRFVISEGHLGPTVADCGGLTVYFPTPTDRISPYYRDLSFARSHGWDGFLNAYHRAVSSKPR